jgi:transposase
MPKAKPPSRADSKREALRRQGTLNLRPQTVTDELFVDQEFFDARDFVQVKYEMLLRVEKDGHSISAAAAACGFSRPSFYQAHFPFEQGGLAGLVPLKRGPKKAHKVTPEIVEFLRSERRRDLSLRAVQLAALTKERFHVLIHPRTIERGLERGQKKRTKPE